MKKSPKVGLGVICVLLIMASSDAGQNVKNQGTSPTRKDSVGKALSDLTEQVNKLENRIRVLETEQIELRAQPLRVQRPLADLSEVDSELARFDCEPEFNRAHAMALSSGTQGYTLEGAAAMNCVQRFAKITEKAVHSLQNR